MKSRFTYKHTIYACFLGYIVQAVVNNFVPLLFLTFRDTYGIPLSKITLLITFNFVLQLTIDLLSASFIDRIGYRASAVLAHIFAAAGLLSLTILPELMGDPFTGILLSVIVYALGGGLLEVLVSPIVEACPSDNKASAMSLLHSFYCWGQVGVILLSTLFFTTAGIGHWKILARLWALVPLANILLFAVVPIGSLLAEDEKGMSFRQLFSSRIFWILMLMMFAAGASEMAISQWASAFAEMGLGVTKTIGDLAGPMFFAVLMGSARTYYGKKGDRIHLENFMLGSSLLLILGYLITAVSPWPFLSLLGCGLCGLSVGIMWPGTFSLATSRIRGGGTLMFALFALAGDMGCSLGPTAVGQIAGALNDNLYAGILCAVLFPVLMASGIVLCRHFPAVTPPVSDPPEPPRADRID